MKYFPFASIKIKIKIKIYTNKNFDALLRCIILGTPGWQHKPTNGQSQPRRATN